MTARLLAYDLQQCGQVGHVGDIHTSSQNHDSVCTGCLATRLLEASSWHKMHALLQKMGNPARRICCSQLQRAQHSRATTPAGPHANLNLPVVAQPWSSLGPTKGLPNRAALHCLGVAGRRGLLQPGHPCEWRWRVSRKYHLCALSRSSSPRYWLPFFASLVCVCVTKVCSQCSASAPNALETF